MKFNKKIYYGENAKKKGNRIIKKLKTNAGQLNTYVITLPVENNGLLEIYHTTILMHDYFRKQPLEVVGIACGYEEALSVVVKIIDEVYEKTGQFDVRNYLREKAKQLPESLIE